MYKSTTASAYFRRQALYWLIAAGAILAAWLILWLAASAPKIITDTKKEEITSQDIALPTRIDTLGELNKEVAPIDFSTLVRDLRTYPAEFKDHRFFEAAKNSYAIELMDVRQHEVIVDYLNGREDRDQFAYFRYLDADKQPRYVLTYGKFSNADTAQSQLSVTDFGLPASVRLSVAPVSRYIEMIDDYERGSVVRDSSPRQPRSVNLQATKREIPVQAATPADDALAQRSREQAAKIAKAREAALARAQEQGIGAPSEAGNASKTRSGAVGGSVFNDGANQPSEKSNQKPNQPAHQPAAQNSLTQAAQPATQAVQPAHQPSEPPAKADKPRAEKADKPKPENQSAPDMDTPASTVLEVLSE
ncbi:hypothetical protein B0181_06725 [Moraxella caviae]|uniref:Uncharacterized protein n=1 Tax=Moraxella caviae TaxID=34060 RepID=A0A1T0A0U1_9GAMM|nr:hypothetical protein [Moraxella caviae]OOR89374.1 hypothetical protein B0181_06725 [Moraxella caviae]STZ09904.1 Uncharacterised protein [Moraxella caviae]VEW12786.1 Uncharacterised protein [Moraxella caviae]